ncbi:MAG: right-handed parallel beta-helix repeat-containing protein [bacterium]|nr:right-handed parallel beta-helix repeat-containing protein [bacterium]
MIRRILISALYLWALGAFSVTHGQVHLSGNLSGTYPDTTYLVEGHICVPSGTTVNIMPGAIFLFRGDYCFSISGNLQAVGTAQDSIYFTSAAGISGGWQGLGIYGVNASASLLEYAVISKSSNSGIRCGSSDPTIQHCSIVDNRSPMIGAGISLISSNPIIGHCIINRNHCRGEGGGGINIINSNPLIENCVITENSCRDWGGGIEFLEGSSGTTVKNCLIARNVAGIEGGGIALFGGSAPLIENCTIINNLTHVGSGGGILGSTAIVSNSIIWGNRPGQIWYNANVTFSDVQDGYPGVGNIDLNPLFIAGPEGRCYLSQIAAGQTQQSPCVDAGNPASLILRGTTRTDGIQDDGVIDMGYHFPIPEYPIASAAFRVDQLGAANSVVIISATPNPFNPSTTLTFALPEAGNVHLTIYDVAGRQVAELVNGYKDAGSHQATFDGSNLSSGIYFVRLDAANQSALQKIVLLK